MPRRDALGGSSGIGGLAARPDDRIRDDIREALRAHGRLRAESVAVVVDGGVVTLTGTVATAEDRHDVAELARGVLGVREIQNQLVLDQADETRPTRPICT